MPMMHVHLKMPKEMVDNIEKIAKEREQNRSQLIRLAVKEFLNGELNDTSR